MVRRMHSPTPLSLPEVDSGLHLVRWNTRGFLRMRQLQLLDRKGEFELVDGIVLHRDAGSRRHDRVVAELARRLERAAADVAVGAELCWRKLDAVVTPDIVVRRAGKPPRLIVEVSDDAPRLDAQEKARLYARARVEEYWHIDLAWRFVQIHAGPHDDCYGTRISGPPYRSLPTHLPELPEIQLDELVAAADAGA